MAGVEIVSLLVVHMAAVLILIGLIRGESRRPQDEEMSGGLPPGGGGPAPAGPWPHGGLPLADAAPGRVRLREEVLLRDQLPCGPRRGSDCPGRTPARVR